MTPKQIRKELWDYFEAQGIVISHTQHEEIKEIIERYVYEAAEVTKGTYKQALKDLQKFHEGFKAWHKDRSAQRLERNRRKRERQKLATETNLSEDKIKSSTSSV